MQKYYVTVATAADKVTFPATRWHKDPECKVLHRIGGPAIEYTDGDYYWYVDGKQHRLDGPASKCNGHKEWRIEGKLHRIGGPAIEYTDGDYYWYVDGKQHRLDGPAVELADGRNQWWLDDKELTEQEHARRTAPANEMTVAQIEAALGYKVKVVK